MKKRKLTPTEAKILVKTWNESEGNLNLAKVARSRRARNSDTPLFSKEKQESLF